MKTKKGETVYKSIRQNNEKKSHIQNNIFNIINNSSNNNIHVFQPKRNKIKINKQKSNETNNRNLAKYQKPK